MNIYTDENYGDLGNLGYGLKQIQNAMIFLRDKLEESGQLLDKSLLFQDPYIIKTWASITSKFVQDIKIHENFWWFAQIAVPLPPKKEKK